MTNSLDYSSLKRQRRTGRTILWLRFLKLRFLKLRYLVIEVLVTGELVTPQVLYSAAQGREAHPGMKFRLAP